MNKSIKEKLINFPPIYYITLSDSVNRQKLFEEQFFLNGIKNVNMVEAYDGRKINYCEENNIVGGQYLHQMDSGQIAATISHLKAISEWYYNSNSEYAIFFEDDMLIESVNDWNFTWDEFISILPENWKTIQLSLIKDNIKQDDMKLIQRDIINLFTPFENWSAGSYLIRRNYAKELIEYFYQNKKYFLQIKNNNYHSLYSIKEYGKTLPLLPLIEHCLFALANTNAYTIPLFYENTNFESTFYPHFIQNSHKGFQVDSSNYVKNWWKTKGKDKSLDDFKLIKNKLKNFPSINFISIEESQDRRDILLEMFEKHGIYNATPHIYKKYKDEDHKIIEGPIINDISKGPVTSHLKTIKAWYEDTDEEYTFICEDDISFDTVQYWNFTWDEFFNSLPKDWKIIQLCLTRENMFYFFDPEVTLRKRVFCDYGAYAYLISRKHAEKLLKNYYSNDYFHLEYKGNDKEHREREKDSRAFLFPHAENLIYSNFGDNNYVFPLFVENISFKSVWNTKNNTGYLNDWLYSHSHNEIINWWTTTGQNKNINELSYKKS